MKRSVAGPTCVSLLGASLLIAVLSVTAIPAPAADNPDQVAAYSFDQGAGAILTDDSGHGKAGAITNGVWTTGRYGTALSFDGTAFVNIGDFASVTTPYTIEFWVAISALPTSGFYKLFGQGGCCALLPAVLLDSSGLTVQMSPERFVEGARTFTAADLNRWYHVAAVVDSTAAVSNWKVYVDGVDITSRWGSDTGAVSTFGEATSIGGNDAYTGFTNFQGQIDELRIYNVALTAAQIQADMVTPIGVP